MVDTSAAYSNTVSQYSLYACNASSGSEVAFQKKLALES